MLESLDIIEGEKTPIEIRMNENGYMSWQQKFEANYWFDFSKFWFLNYQNQPYDVDFRPETGQLELKLRDEFSFLIFKNQVPQILKKLAQNEQICTSKSFPFSCSRTGKSRSI